MRFTNLSEYGLDIKSRREERDPLGLREHIVRADLLDELHGVVLPHRRAASAARKRER